MRTTLTAFMLVLCISFLAGCGAGTQGGPAAFYAAPPEFVSLSDAAATLKTRPVGTDGWQVYYASGEYLFITYNFGHELIFRYNIAANEMDKALCVNPDGKRDWSAGASFTADGKKAYVYPGIPEFIVDLPSPNRFVYLVDFETEDIALVSQDGREFTLPSDIVYYQWPEDGDSIYSGTAKKYLEQAEKNPSLPRFPSDWCNIIEIEEKIYVLIMPSDDENAWPGEGYFDFKILLVDTALGMLVQKYEIHELT